MADCALLVTAHPDDEAMFWAPTILALLERGLRVALLCLSTGSGRRAAAVVPYLCCCLVDRVQTGMVLQPSSRTFSSAEHLFCFNFTCRRQCGWLGPGTLARAVSCLQPAGGEGKRRCCWLLAVLYTWHRIIPAFHAVNCECCLASRWHSAPCSAGLPATCIQWLLPHSASPQIRRQDVTLVDDPRLQDGMQQAWPADAVAEHVAAAVQRLRPTHVSDGLHQLAGCGASRWHLVAAGRVFHPLQLGNLLNPSPSPLLPPCQVYTFDAGGVSGHPNHLAVCAGVLRWWAASPSSSSAASLPQLWQLETVGLLRKYAAVLDAPLAWATTALRRRQQAHGEAAWHLCRQPRRAQRALLAHSSQMVW